MKLPTRLGLLSVATLFVVAGGSASTFINKNISKPIISQIISAPKPQTVNLVAVGDVMIGSWYPSEGFLPDDDAKNSFAAVAPYLQGDVVFGNLEGAIVENTPSTKCTITQVNCYAFAMPNRYAALLKDAGFNLMSIANNHVGDFGDVGRASTVANLDKVGIINAGLLSKPVATFSQNGVKYGFVAFSPNIGTVNINDLDSAKKLVADLDKQTDIVIVSFHGGAEGANHTRVPKTTEFYLNENRGDVHKFAHAMIDVGADVIIGHGPHVVRAVELYKDRFIAYSLGNFNTYGAFNVRGANGLAPLIDIKMDTTGKFISAEVISAHQTKDKGLQLDSTPRAFNEIKRLTQLDFPDTPLVFTDGKIERR